MNQTDQGKLIKAGYTIIRAEDLGMRDMRIKFKGTGSNEWKTLEKGFVTKAALKRRMDVLLKDDKTIQD